MKDNDWSNLEFSSTSLAICIKLGELTPPLRPVVDNQGSFCPLEDIWQYQEAFLAVTSWGRGVTWDLVGKRPRMLLNILQSTGQPLTTKRLFSPQYH